MEYLIKIKLKDEEDFLLSVTTKDLPHIDISINRTTVDANQLEDYFTLKLYSFYFLITPMRKLESYEMTIVNSKDHTDKMEGWRSKIND